MESDQGDSKPTTVELSSRNKLYRKISDSLSETEVESLRELMITDGLIARGRVQNASPHEILNILEDDHKIGKGDLGLLKQILKALGKEMLAMEAEDVEKKEGMKVSNVNKRNAPEDTQVQVHVAANKKLKVSSDEQRSDHPNGSAESDLGHLPSATCTSAENLETRDTDNGLQLGNFGYSQGLEEPTKPKPPDSQPIAKSSGSDLESEEAQAKQSDVELRPLVSELEIEETQSKPPDSELESEETQPKPPNSELESEETQPKPPDSELEIEETQSKPPDSELEIEEAQSKPPDSELGSEQTQPKPADTELGSEETRPKQQQKRPPKDVLKSCRKDIIDSIHPVILSILDQLIQDDVLEDRKYEDIKLLTPRRGATELVDYLCTLEQLAYDSFKKALKDAKLPHLVKKLEEAETCSSWSQLSHSFTPLSSLGTSQNDPDQSSLTEDTLSQTDQYRYTDSNTQGQNPTIIQHIHVHHADNVHIDHAASSVDTGSTKRAPLDTKTGPRMSFPEGTDKLTKYASQHQFSEDTCVKQATVREEPQTSDDAHVPSNSAVNILLVGCKRNGKSETGNTLLNQNAFKVSRKGGTQESMKCTHTLDGQDGVSRTVTVVDTPGLSGVPKQSELDEIKKGANMVTGGVDAVALVWSDRSDENAEKEAAVMKSLLQIFGDNLYQHLVIIVTHMDQEDLPQFVQDLPGPMKDMVNKCGNRIVALDNKAEDDNVKSHQTEQFFTATSKLPTQKLHVRHQACSYTQKDHKPPPNIKGDTSEDINLLLVGCKGNGKSSTANTILGENVFVVSGSGTEESQRGRTSYRQLWRHDLEIVFEVTDTPGVSEEMTESEFDQLERAVHMSPEGFDAIVLVWPDRMSANLAKMEMKAFESLRRMFGDALFNHLLIAVTGTKHDSIPTYCQKLPESLKSIQERSHAIIGIDNEYKRANTKAIHQLIEAAQDIKRNHHRYTTDHMNRSCQIEPGDELRVAVIGKTGSGKSSTANMIVGSEEFKVTCSASSQTTRCTYKSRKKGDRKIGVVDTPGLCDTHRNLEEVSEEICRIATIFSEGLHALLLVVTLSRFTKEEADAIDMLKKLFGKEFMEYVVIVLTHKDDIDNDPMFKGDVDKYIQKAPQNFRDLLKDCKERYVLFNNKTKDETLKREQLATLVNLITHKKAGDPFRDKIFEEGQKEKEKIKEELSNMDNPGFQNHSSVQAVRNNPRGQNNDPDDMKRAYQHIQHKTQKVTSDNAKPAHFESQDAKAVYTADEESCENMTQDQSLAAEEEVPLMLEAPHTCRLAEQQEKMEEEARENATNRSFKGTTLYIMIKKKLQGLLKYFASCWGLVKDGDSDQK